jgi:hypothetical protein
MTVFSYGRIFPLHVNIHREVKVLLVKSVLGGVATLVHSTAVIFSQLFDIVIVCLLFVFLFLFCTH